jgi:hypothetical protein
MRIGWKHDGAAMIARDRVPALAPPSRTVGRVVKVGVLGNSHGVTRSIILEISALARPWLSVPGSIQKGMIRYDNGNAGLTLSFIATVTKPKRPI